MKLALGLRFRSTAFEPPRDETNKMACASCEDLDQPGHPYEESSSP